MEKVDPSEDAEQKPHREAGRSRVKRDEEDVNAIIGTVLEQMPTPSDTESHKTKSIMNLATGKTSDEDVSKDLVAARQIGHSCMTDFVSSRLTECRSQVLLTYCRNAS